MMYTVVIKNGLAIARVKGHESYVSMPESHALEYMKNVTKIAKSEGVTVTWEITEEV